MYLALLFLFLIGCGTPHARHVEASVHEADDLLQMVEDQSEDLREILVLVEKIPTASPATAQ